MKKYLFLIILLVSFTGFAQEVSMQKAQMVAQTFLKTHSDCSIESTILRSNADGKTLFYIFNTLPTGFVVVAADEQIEPIIGWSTNSQFDVSMPFTKILEDEISNRIEKYTILSDAQKAGIGSRWKSLTEENFQPSRVQTWPEEGTTSTGGWIDSRWTQTAPYNQMCPMDPVSNSRSYAGCPAIVMGQIINYLKTTNQKRFDDTDDYYHNYSGRRYYIDDDADSLGFPSFPELNNWLDSIEKLYQSGGSATGKAAASVVFACGTACTQVYTSQASGTFAVNQAFDAYKSFNFDQCRLFETPDSTMYATLISNLKDGFPAHLAVVDEAWSMGHNVAVDGYRTDGYYHINFGWGGSSDGWWLLPDPSFPYGMGVLEGIVVDIIPQVTGITDVETVQNMIFYPNPASHAIYLESIENELIPYSIYSLNGQLIQSGETSGTISVSSLKTGVYILQLKSEKGTRFSKLEIKR